jgi:hypothetical protein
MIPKKRLIFLSIFNRSLQEFQLDLTIFSDENVTETLKLPTFTVTIKSQEKVFYRALLQVIPNPGVLA